MCLVDVEGDEMTADVHQCLSLGRHPLPDPNQYHAHLPTDVPVPYPDPVRLLEGDQGHPKEEAIIVVVEEEAGEAETAESVADHQLQIRLDLVLQDLLDVAEDPPLPQCLHRPLQGREKPAAIALLAPDPFLAHAQDQEALISYWLQAEAELQLHQPRILMKTGPGLERTVTNIG